jgi:hypothetical protein
LLLLRGCHLRLIASTAGAVPLILAPVRFRAQLSFAFWGGEDAGCCGEDRCGGDQAHRDGGSGSIHMENARVVFDAARTAPTEPIVYAAAMKVFPTGLTFCESS